MSHGGDQSIEHPADHAVVHPGGSYPSLCCGVWGIETALRPLSQRVTPAAVMLAAASSQEERHRLGRLLSPLRGGPLHPDQRPRDVNCGAGPCRQVTECWEGRNIQSVKDSQLKLGRGFRSPDLLLVGLRCFFVPLQVRWRSRHHVERIFFRAWLVARVTL